MNLHIQLLPILPTTNKINRNTEINKSHNKTIKMSKNDDRLTFGSTVFADKSS